MKNVIILPVFAIYLFVAGCGNQKTTHELVQYQNIDSLSIFAPELWLENNTYKGSFSDDYKTFFFFRKLTPDQEKYIPYQSTFEGGKWSQPKVAEYYNDSYSSTYQLKVPGADKLIFLSDKRTKMDTAHTPNYNFWSIEQSNGIYGSMEELGPQNLIYNYNSQPSLSKKGTIYFTSDTPDWSETYSYRMRLINNKYSEPEPFEPVNKWRENRDRTVFEFTMSPDEDYIIVCIQEKSDTGVLNTDLYISFLENTGWSLPKKLGNIINTAETENFPVITADGKYLIFTRAFSQFYIIPIDKLMGTDLSIGQNTVAASNETLKLSYIGNMGVLVENQGKTVLFDGFHKEYRQEYVYPTESMVLDLIQGSYNGFSKIDVACVTHIHRDHFNSKYCNNFLEENQEAIVVGSIQVKQEILRFKPENREKIKHAIKAVEYNNEIHSIDHQGIKVKAIQCNHVNSTRHGNIENIAYLADINNFTILHVGDTNWDLALKTFENLELKNNNVDVAILPYWMLMEDSSRERVQKLIDPKHIIATHIPPGFSQNDRQEMVQRFPAISLFTKLGEHLTYTKTNP